MGIVEDDYTNRELNMCFEQITEKLDLIHTQTVKTNGRVGRLENWQNRIIGGMVAISALAVPILVYIVKTWVK